MNENESPIDFSLTWDDWMQYYGRRESMKDKQKELFGLIKNGKNIWIIPNNFVYL